MSEICHVAKLTRKNSKMICQNGKGSSQMHKSKAKNQNTPKAQFPNVPGPVRRELFAAMTRGPNESRLELEAARILAEDPKP